ncbi:MAG TPA: hypothetical protein VGE53_00405 [Candidatus Paceibacterota bacterium]
MNRNVVLGIVVVIALAVLGWWVFAFMMPASGTPLDTEAVSEDVTSPNAEEPFSLSGTWRSTQDPRFIRVFAIDGSVTDYYEGEESATVIGRWNVVEDANAEQPEFATLSGMRTIKIEFPEEVLYFAVVTLTDEKLELSYLARGNTLSFTRVR